MNSNGVIYGVKKYTASSANWKKKIELEELKSVEDTIFEASTRAVEWALDSGKEVGIFIYLKDPEFEHREYMSLSYKVLSNAGHYKLAEFQGFKCPLSGMELVVKEGEIYDPTTNKRIAIDHDHQTGFIRGLLIQKVNWLVDQWEQNSYGVLSMPPEIL